MVCNTSSDIAPIDWLYYIPRDVEDFTRSFPNCWPWTHLNYSEWMHIADKLCWARYMEQSVSQISLLIWSAFGVPGSLLCVLTFWHKATVRKERFYCWMFAIAMLEFFEHIVALLTVLGFHGVLGSAYRFSYGGTVFSKYVYVMLLTIFLASDLCTLTLTLERYLAISYPTRFQNTRIKNIFTLIAVLGVSMFSIIRFVRYTLYYDIETEVDRGTVTYEFTSSDLSHTLWFTTFMALGDIVCPFSVLSITVFISTKIAQMITSRRKSRVQDSASSSQRSSIYEHSAATIRLMLITVSFFVLNQVGYTAYVITLITLRLSGITYESTADDVSFYVRVRIGRDGAGVMAYTLAGISKSMNFWFYYCFSNSFRAEYRRFLGRRRGEVVTVSKVQSFGESRA